MIRIVVDHSTVSWRRVCQGLWKQKNWGMLPRRNWCANDHANGDNGFNIQTLITYYSIVDGELQPKESIQITSEMTIKSRPTMSRYRAREWCSWYWTWGKAKGNEQEQPERKERYDSKRRSPSDSWRVSREDESATEAFFGQGLGVSHWLFCFPFTFICYRLIK